MGQRYEYRTDTLNIEAGASLTRHIEGMEDQGWEFAAVIDSSERGSIVVLMRRPR